MRWLVGLLPFLALTRADFVDTILETSKTLISTGLEHILSSEKSDLSSEDKILLNIFDIVVLNFERIHFTDVELENLQLSQYWTGDPPTKVEKWQITLEDYDVILNLDRTLTADPQDLTQIINLSYQQNYNVCQKFQESSDNAKNCVIRTLKSTYQTDSIPLDRDLHIFYLENGNQKFEYTAKINFYKVVNKDPLKSNDVRVRIFSHFSMTEEEYFMEKLGFPIGHKLLVYLPINASTGKCLQLQVGCDSKISIYNLMKYQSSADTKNLEVYDVKINIDKDPIGSKITKLSIQKNVNATDVQILAFRHYKENEVLRAFLVVAGHD